MPHKRSRHSGSGSSRATSISSHDDLALLTSDRFFEPEYPPGDITSWRSALHHRSAFCLPCSSLPSTSSRATLKVLKLQKTATSPNFTTRSPMSLVQTSNSTRQRAVRCMGISISVYRPVVWASIRSRVSTARLHLSRTTHHPRSAQGKIRQYRVGGRPVHVLGARGSK
jgi:hypothetical protein